MDIVVNEEKGLLVSIMGCDCIFKIVVCFPKEHCLVGVTTQIEVCMHIQEKKQLISEQICHGIASTLGVTEDDQALKQVQKAMQTNQRNIRFEQLGGVSQIITQLKEVVVNPLKRPYMFEAYGLKPPKGILLYGSPGVGKSTLAVATAMEAGSALYCISGGELVCEFSGESERNLKAIFVAARLTAPSIIFIDEIDAIAGKREDGQSSDCERLVTALLTLIDTSPNDVVVIGTSNRPQQLDNALRRPGRFDREVEIVTPDVFGRQQMLVKRLEHMNHNLGMDEIKGLSLATGGYVAADIAALCDEACLCCLRRYVDSGVDNSGLVVCQLDFDLAITKVRASGMRQVQFEVPVVSWDDIGGLADIKQILKESIEWPYKMRNNLLRYGTTLPKGILLFGPPGCSKTMLAKAISHEANMNFVALKGGAPELFNKYVGESEKAVAQLFSRARQVAPSVVFIDEIDTIGDASSDVSRRILSQLLIEIDGLLTSAGVVILAATNCPQNVDKALLRPGRFDRTIYIPLPHLQNRRAILQVILKNISLSEDVDLTILAEKSEGFSGADLAGMCRDACFAAIELSGESTHYITMRNFQQALTLYLPRNVLDPHTIENYVSFQRRIQL